jgi:hypothetical protein
MEVRALNRRTALLLLAVMLGSVLVTYFALQRRSRHLSVTDINDSRVQKISRVGPIQLRVPLYLPPKTQTLAVELSYDGEVWNSFLHAVTMLSLDEVYQFYRQRYFKERVYLYDSRTPRTFGTLRSRQPPYFVLVVFPDPRQERLRFSFQVYPKVFSDDAKQLDLSERQSNMTYIFVSLPEPQEFNKLGKPQQKVKYIVLLPRAAE